MRPVSKNGQTLLFLFLLLVAKVNGQWLWQGLVMNCLSVKRDPTGYLQEKGLDFNVLNSQVGLSVHRDQWYGHCLEYPLINTQGKIKGSERIFPRGVLHQYNPEKFSKKDNKKVTKGTKTSKCFTLIGIAVSELTDYCGTLRVVGGLADAVSVYQATNEPVVSIVGENNAASVVTQLIEQWPHLKKHLLVALDHDLPGISACQRAGCSWLVPEHYGDDWSDVRQREGLPALQKQLDRSAQKPLYPVDPNTITIDPQLSRTIQNQNYKQATGTLKKVCTENPEQAAAVALKVIHKFHRLIPSKLSEQQLLDAIRMTCRFCVHPDTLRALTYQLHGLRKQSLDIVHNSDSFSEPLIQTLGDHYHIVKDSISPRTIDLVPEQLIFIKAGHGTGKTKTARALVNGLSNNPDVRIVSIGANRSLVQETSESFALEHYQNIHPDIAATVNRLATTIHSLNKSQVFPVYRKPDGSLRKIDVLILDEITQILGAFVSGQIAQPESVFYTLLDLIEKTVENGGVVLCMDADLSSEVIRQFRTWFPQLLDQMQVYDKAYEDKGLNVRFGTGIKAKNAAIADLLERVNLGQTITVASDSKKLVNTLRQQIEQHHQDLKCLTIHADNSSHPEEKSFLQNPNAEATKYSVVLYSPAIIGGLSVTSVKPDHCFVFSYNKLDAPAVMQQMFRYRKTEHFTVIGDLMPVSKDCEDFLRRIHSMERMFSLERVKSHDQSKPCAANDYVGFVEKQKASNARLLAMGANGLWDYLEQRKVKVEPLSNSLNLEDDYTGTSGELKAIRQQNRAALPGKLINASPLSDSQYKQVHCLPFKTDDEQLSCQRYRICNELGVNPQKLTEEDCDIWLDVGLPTLTCFSAARGFEVTEDCTDTPLCHRKFESMLQKYLHYLLEPILKDDYIFKDFWSRKEAFEIVERIMAMDENDQWALQRLRLIPGSMIAGSGSHQTIVRPKNPTDYVNNYLLANRLGLKHSSYQQRLGQKREWRYKICEKSLFIMTRYAEQRAKAHGLKQVSRVEGKLLSIVSAGQPVETFIDWYQRRWGGKTITKIASSNGGVDPVVLAFFGEGDLDRDGPRPSWQEEESVINGY